jgi:hypothetical protein
MYDRKELYIKLAALHLKLDSVNKGDDWYHQFHTLFKANGPTCPYLGVISKQLKPDFIEKEIEDLIKEYNEFRAKPSS